MKSIFDTSKIVRRMLEKYPSCRDSDDVLYEKVVYEIYPEAVKVPFYQYMRMRKDFGCPPFETVRRSRQKIQADNPELRSSQKVIDAKYENWKVVREYAVSDSNH